MTTPVVKWARRIVAEPFTDEELELAKIEYEVDMACAALHVACWAVGRRKKGKR